MNLLYPACLLFGVTVTLAGFAVHGWVSRRISRAVSEALSEPFVQPSHCKVGTPQQREAM